MVKWHQYLGEVDYQYTVSCILLFLMLPTKNYKHIFNFVKVINRNSVSFFTSDTIKP